ncbi:phage major capsid protein [Dietzia sp. WMMA184]|uniref:phage major capsid protein n=1 Tax=Dietzia sp. WMMA184 TaxID=2039808 RepID=UPI000BDED43B|nr:phage major capsid protein [Dietzia sp. WMMA184]
MAGRLPRPRRPPGHRSAELSATIHPGAELKSLLPAGGSVTDSVTVAPGLVQTPQIPTSFLQLLSTVTVDSPDFAYLRQIARNNAAAPVAPGAPKPTSEYGLDRVEGSLRVVAHLTEPVGKYDLIDVDALTRFLDSELRYGLFSCVEDQVLNGDGTGQNLTGLLETSGVQTQPFADDLLTTLRRSVTKLENVGHQPTAVVIRPEDWEAVELSTSSGSGEFTFASSPIDRAARRVWGVQVAVSNALPVGSAVMLDTSTLALYSDRQGVAVEWSTSGDDFDRNQVRARCEGRFPLAVYQPTGSVIVSTSAATGV